MVTDFQENILNKKDLAKKRSAKKKAPPGFPAR